MIRRSLQFALLTAALPSPSLAAEYQEAVYGDLSSDRLAPTPIVLTGGDNRIAGTVILGDRDYFTVDVPSGLALSAILLEQYDSSNAKAFLPNGTNGVDFVSKEGASVLGFPNGEPTLTVDFTPVPEPGTLVGMCIGIPVLMIRRRRFF